MIRLFFIGILFVINVAACGQIATNIDIYPADIKVGAAQFEQYLPSIKDKRVAVCANHTSMVGNSHLVDTLLALKINVVKVFSPEHGFRGEAEAGKHISSVKDEKTGLPLISLYGKTKKPSVEDMQNLDVVLFDIDSRWFEHVIDGKTFSRKDGDRNKNYGKHIFSQYVLHNYKSINFKNFNFQKLKIKVFRNVSET